VQAVISLAFEKVPDGQTAQIFGDFRNLPATHCDKHCCGSSVPLDTDLPGGQSWVVHGELSVLAEYVRPGLHASHVGGVLAVPKATPVPALQLILL
jgi:hypothetical protein